MNLYKVFVCRYLKYVLIGGLLLTAVTLPAQQVVPKETFRSPLNSPLYLNGTFGELRSGHLHAGIDISTGGVQGKKVYAVDGGYISRINISLGGYGKALYITHPNGTTSVYGHLQRFNNRLENFVRSIQYQRERFTVEIFPEKGKFPVTKGQLIAYSGNTGGSDGPHLHFEIRDSKSQNPLNPLLFKGIRIKDVQAPKLVQLVIYPVNHFSTINGKRDTAFYWIAGKGMHCFIKGNPLIKVAGPVSFGIRTYDVMGGRPNHNGIYQIELFEDARRVFDITFNRFSFQTTRYVNSLIDYNYFQKKGKRIVRTQVDTNNRLPVYKKVQNRGIFPFRDTLVHHFEFRVKDAYGNASKVPFRIQWLGNVANTLQKKPNPVSADGKFINFRNACRINSGRIHLTFTPNTFYRSFTFYLHKKPESGRGFAPIFVLHNRFVPVQKYFKIAIRPDSVGDSLHNKLFIAFLPPKGQDAFNYAGSRWKDNWLTARVRQLGTYTVMADTVCPEIKALNFHNLDTLDHQKSIRLSINDHETGIKNYRPSLNGHWILMEYNPKLHTLTYHFDQYFKKGKNELQVVVSDEVGNISRLKAVLYRND